MANALLAEVRDWTRIFLAEEGIQPTPGDVLKAAIAVVERLILAAQAGGGDGAAKRAAVLAALDAWYDEYVEPWDLPLVPDVVGDVALKWLVLFVAGKTLDGLVLVLKRRGMLDSVAP